MCTEIRGLYVQFDALMDEVLASIKKLSDAKGTTALPAAREKMISVFSEADTVTTRLIDYHRERYDAWSKKRAELAGKANFYKEVSREK